MKITRSSSQTSGRHYKTIYKTLVRSQKEQKKALLFSLQQPKNTIAAVELIKKERENKKKVRKFVRSIIQKFMPFNSYLANSRSVSYSFSTGVGGTENLSSTNQKQNFASNLLTVSFLNMGCLISKPSFKLVPTENVQTTTLFEDQMGQTSALEDSEKGSVIRVRQVVGSTQNTQQALVQTLQTKKGVRRQHQTDNVSGGRLAPFRPKKWTIRLFFYVRNPLKLFFSNASKLFLQQTLQTQKMLTASKGKEVGLAKDGLIHVRGLRSCQTMLSDKQNLEVSPQSVSSLVEQGTSESSKSVIPTSQTQENERRLLELLSGKNQGGKSQAPFLELYRNNITYLVKELSNIFKTDIELEIIQLKRSYHNSNILAQHLNLRSYKYRFVRLINKFLRKFSYIRNSRQTKFPIGQTVQPRRGTNSAISGPESLSSLVAGLTQTKDFELALSSKISGVKIKLGGRTFKQRIIPRKTVQQLQRGSLAKDKVNLIEKSRITGKTRRGAYSFTVTLGHVVR